MVGYPSEVNLPMMVAGCAGVVGNERRPTLRTNQGRGEDRHEQKNEWKKPAHSSD
jgi:hypothetical protein